MRSSSRARVPRESGGVCYGAVARDGLGQAHPAQEVVGVLEQMFDAAVLVAQGDFEVEHLLAVADEAERSGLDDARVDGPDVDFVERTALHGVERIARRWRSRRDGAPGAGP